MVCDTNKTILSDRHKIVSVCRTILLGGCWCYLTIFSRLFSPMNMGWFIIMVGFDNIFIRGMTVLITR